MQNALTANAKIPSAGPIAYRPVRYAAGVFTITWICAVVLSYFSLPGPVSAALDFVKSASPLLVSLFLMRKYLTGRFLLKFFLGSRCGVVPLAAAALLFTAQFFNFYWFCPEKGETSIAGFAAVFAGQLIFGGALEEAGWRGYLQPAFERKIPAVLAAPCVGLVWAAWHLPYFFLPGSMHTNGNFLFYCVTVVGTSFILAAIYKLTGSVLLCTLFHAWQNTIVMTVPADMSSPGFITVFALLGVVSALLLCIGKRRAEAGGIRREVG